MYTITTTTTWVSQPSVFGFAPAPAPEDIIFCLLTANKMSEITFYTCMFEYICSFYYCIPTYTLHLAEVISNISLTVQNKY